MSKFFFDPLTRRSFIQGLGGLVVVPLLPSLFGEKAEAATLNTKRFIAMTTPNQLPSNHLFPSGLATSTVPADLAAYATTINEGRFNYRSTSLAGLIASRGQISPFLDSSLNPSASKLALFRGLDMPGRIDHGRGTALGNLAASHLGTEKKYKPMRTMDEFLANSTNFYTNGKLSYRFPILRTGESSISTSNVSDADSSLGLGIGGNNAGLTLNGNLSQIFDKMYESQTNSLNKAPIVDQVFASVRDVMAGRKIGASDKRKLESYMDTLSSLHQSLASPVPAPGAKPALSFFGSNAPNIGHTATAVNDVRQYYADLAKLIVLAIKTNSTKLITIGIDSALVSAGECISQTGSVTQWHLDAHAGETARLTAAQKFIFDSVFVEVMNNLNVDETAGVTYLDNTMMMYMGECANGHSGIGFTGVLAGHTGALNLGRAYDFTDWSLGNTLTTGNVPIGPGQPINRLWLGLMKSLGLTPADYLSKYGNGSSTFGIWNEYATTYEGEFGNVSRANYVGTQLTSLFK